jgi:hypothetical protein
MGGARNYIKGIQAGHVHKLVGATLVGALPLGGLLV